jgi:hydroxymethylpyrimidine pyrophosphatase-like HAD family hydrolase
VPPLPLEAAEAIAALMRAAGLSAKISSIHVNGWFGGYDKLAMARLLFAEKFATDLEAANAQFAYAGDSPNDAPMFAFFANSIGVANVARFAGHMAALPKFVARAEAGAGFAEIAAHLLGER